METDTGASTIQQGGKGSYPTYKEWKPEDRNIVLKSALGSYPTYKEWKHMSPIFLCETCISVLILPIRNGNLAFATVEYVDFEGFLSYL